MYTDFVSSLYWQVKRFVMLVQSTRLFPFGKPWFPVGKQSSALRLHACSCFYVVKAWKRKEAHDCNPKGYHVFVSFLIDL